MLLHTWTVALRLPLNTGTRHEFFVFLICDHPYIIRYTREESKFKRVAIPRIFGRLHLTGIGNFRFKRIAQFQDGGQFFLIMYGKSNCIVGKIILQFAFWMIAWVYFKDFVHIFNKKCKHQFSQYALKICTSGAQFYNDRYYLQLFYSF